MYDFSWECSHSPTSDPLWQESDWYVFYDEKSGVGGWHRVGQRPNQGTGQIQAFIFARGGQRFLLRYPDQLAVPISDTDRSTNVVRVGRHSAEAIAPEIKRFKWEEPDCSGDLTLHSAFYTPRDWRKGPVSSTFKKFSQVMQSGGKLQSSGRIRGTIVLGSRRYEIDALIHRDRAWGVRDNSKTSYRRLRMFSGTVGPKLSFASATLDLVSGERPCMGYVVQDGAEREVVDLRVAPWIDSDGYSVLGARTVFTLDDGKKLRVDAKAVQGFLHVLHDTREVVSDTICTVDCAGERGFCDLAITNNPGRGTHIPSEDELTLADFTPGLTDFVTYDL